MSVIVCALAAYRLAGTPLEAAAWGPVVGSLACLVAPWVSRGGQGRGTTAVQHLSLALGGFLLFVSFAVRV